MENKLGQAVLQANKMGKLKLGYSVDNYSEVLSALDKAKLIQELKLNAMKNWQSAGQNADYDSQGNIISTQSIRYTDLLQAGLSGQVDESGFVRGEYQAVCSFRDYMGYTVDVKLDDGTNTTLYVEREDKVPSNSHASEGKGCISGGKPIFPADCKKELGHYTGGEGDGKEPFKIGVALNIGILGVNFFNTFFKVNGDKNLVDEDKLNKIAAIEGLMAEVWVPQRVIQKSNTVTDSLGRKRNLVSRNTGRKSDLVSRNKKSDENSGENYNAFILHLKVVCNVNDSGKPFLVYLPTPVLLLQDYSKFEPGVKINVTLVDKLSKKQNYILVNDGDVLFSFFDKKYNHETCSIEGFDPKFVSNIKDGHICKHSGTQLCKGDKKGRVRLYFNENKKDEVLKILETSEEELKKNKWYKELFKGHYKESDAIKETTITTEYVTGNVVGNGWELPVAQQYFQQIANTLGVDVEVAKAALKGFSRHESGEDWAAWNESERTDPGGSIGKFQFNARIGMVEKFLKNYEALAGKGSVSNELMKDALNKYIRNHKKEMIDICGSDLGICAQLKTWNENYAPLVKKAKEASRSNHWFQLCIICGAVNHLPAYANVVGRYKDRIREMDDAKKAAALIACDIKNKTGFNGNATLWDGRIKEDLKAVTKLQKTGKIVIEDLKKDILKEYVPYDIANILN